MVIVSGYVKEARAPRGDGNKDRLAFMVEGMRLKKLEPREGTETLTHTDLTLIGTELKKLEPRETS